MTNFHSFYPAGMCSKSFTLNSAIDLGGMFSAAALGLYNGILPEIYVALILMVFWKAWKAWGFFQVLD